MDRIPDDQRRDLAIPPAEIEVRAVISNLRSREATQGAAKQRARLKWTQSGTSRRSCLAGM